MTGGNANDSATPSSKGIVYATSDVDAVEWLKENVEAWDQLP